MANTFTVIPQIKKELLYIAHKLPIVMEWHKERHICTIEEAIEHLPENDPKEFTPMAKKGPFADKYLINLPVMVYANHYRRLKKAYAKGGEPAVMAYIQKIKDIPKGA